MTKDDLDIIKVTKWECPSETGIPLITMPNIPKPLHALPPRNIMGKTAWDRARKLCYFKADYKCEICGCEPSKGQLHCLERGSQVLTIDGWKNIENVSTNDQVAQFVPNTEKIEFVNPTSTTKHHENNIVRVGYKRGFSVGMSSEHRVLLFNKRKKEWETVLAKDMPTKWPYYIPASGKGDGVDDLTDDERLMIALQADGSRHELADGRYCFNIRVKKERKAKRLKYLISKTSFRHTEISDRDYVGFLVWTDVDCKKFSNCFAYNMPFQKAISFIDELVKWDGWEGSRGNQPGRCYYTSEKENIDFVQAIAAQAGLGTHLTISHRKVRDWGYLHNYQGASTNCRVAYNLEIKKHGSYGTQTMNKIVEGYNDDVFCITVPSSYFVARTKDGDVFITGNCHELYTIDYLEGTSTFNRCIAICKQDHDFIHSGRLITLFKEGNPLYPKSYVLKTVEKGFKLVSEYNKAHPDLEPLRVYDTFIDYLKVPELADEMAKLIRKYDIKFYASPKRGARWEKWRLVWNGKEYPTPYKNPEEWMEAMKKANQNDTVRQVKDPFTGGVYDELRKMLEQSA